MNKLKLFLIILICCISLMALCQSDRGVEWKSPIMNYKTQVQYSRVWKAVGLTMIAGGIYAGQNKVPQRYDVPLIGFGLVMTIEGIRLRKSAKK